MPVVSASMWSSEVAFGEARAGRNDEFLKAGLVAVIIRCVSNVFVGLSVVEFLKK